MRNSHEGRVALVTGAAKGIGQEIALRLAERGATIILADIDDLTETASRVGGVPFCLYGDVGEIETWAGWADAVRSRFGRADIVVNNAGIYPISNIDELTYELWRKTLRINLDSHFHSAKSFLPMMRHHGWGRFVNISSNSVGTASIGLSHYMAAKMGVIGFVRGLANDVAQHGITVNAVLPGMTNTPGTSGMPEELVSNAWGQQAIKRYGEPQDIAGPVLFLTSDDAAFITGQAIVADGGMYKIS